MGRILNHVPFASDRAYFRGVRSYRGRGAAGGSADACEHGMPSAFGRDRTHHAGHARRLLQLGCEYVLVTGTHEAGVEVVNTLYAGGAVVREDRWQRLPGSYHGSGCTLASAIAAALANGLEVAEAVRDAQEYTWQALAGGFRPGMGQLLPDRFFWAREGEGRK